MEEAQPKQYPNKVITICRSKHEISVLGRFYIAFGLYFAGFMVIAALVVFFCDGMKALNDHIPFVLGMGFAMSLLFSLGHKGSLVETVCVDYTKQEIRVLRYDLLSHQHNAAIPFKGFSWDVMSSGRYPARIRLFPLEGKRIVICKGELGWTFEDCLKLELVLSEIVEKDFWLNKKPSGQW